MHTQLLLKIIRTILEQQEQCRLHFSNGFRTLLITSNSNFIMKNIFLIILSLFLVTSCEKEIDLDLEDQSGQIVIEGNVTDQAGPYYVKITKSVAFTQANQYPAIENAKVVLSDNTGQTETLLYVGNGRYQTSTFVGQSGRTYTLKIQAEGKEYISTSTMPEAVVFEGLDQDSFIVGGETSYTLLPVFADPQALGTVIFSVIRLTIILSNIFRNFQTM
ncbi:DUF4249 family protein [Chryseobacterium formosus]